jgi:lipid II isoglutaminyl synthase (glutamine-hydrolysing)
MGVAVPSAVAGRARFALALAAGKAAAPASRVLRLGGGTSFPGVIAGRIDPRVLQRVAAAPGSRTVIVTGSNGKTTTCRLLAALAQAAGLTVIQNRAGSDSLQGVISAAVTGADLRGRLDAQLLLLEADQETVPRIASSLPPDILLITNLFPDQRDRSGEPDSMPRGLASAIEELPESATVVLNGDDPLATSLAPTACARRLHYGLHTDAAIAASPWPAADSVRCARCQHLLSYSAVYGAHLGDYKCPQCGLARPFLDVAVTAIRTSPEAGTTITADTPEGTFRLDVPLPGGHNVYNAAAALAGVLAVSPEQPLRAADARRAIAGVRPAFGRLEEIQAGRRQVVLAFVKSPASFNATLAEVMQRPGRKHVLAAISNTVVDGEDFAWLWDVNIEQLVPQLASLTASGTRAEEAALRFKYAGADPALIRVVANRPAALDAALAGLRPGETLYIFAGYTPMRELRNAMSRRGWVRPFWKE